MPENQLKYSQLIYRSLIFLLVALVLLFILVNSNNEISDNYYFSKIRITKTFIFHILIIFSIWFLYLVFVTKDNSINKIVNVIKLRGTFSTPKEILIRWYVLFILLVVPVVFSQNIIIYINSLNSNLLYQGSIEIQSSTTKNEFDKRFSRIRINYQNREIELFGNKKDVDNVMGKKVIGSIYQGLFYEYAVIDKQGNIKK
ncbi:MAG: hypothetical protein ACN6OB_02515 [Chryseobacterium jejuense]